MSLSETLRERLAPVAQLFAGPADDRIYAAVRIGFSAVALLNLAMMWPDREMLFGPGGMMIPEAAVEGSTAVHGWVFDFLRGSGAVAAYLLFNVVCLFLLMLGVAPRAAAVAVFVWHLSYHARAPLGLGGWDNVLGAFSFLVMISPKGGSWSLSRRQRGRATGVEAAYGLTLMRLQVAVVYWQTVVLKLLHAGPYWRNGEFMGYYLLSRYARDPGAWVAHWTGLMALLTWGALIIEMAVPLLMMIKAKRFYGMALGILLHFGICVVSKDLELFLITMAATYLAFLRDEDVAAIQRWFDGVRRGRGGVG